MTLQSYDWLLTAHHADDQMETMLMKMVREGRLQNASGIKRKQPFGNGYLIRPFLTIAKEEIRDYARRRGSLISKMKRISKRCFKEIACVIKRSLC